MDVNVSERTSYRGYVVIVDAHGFTILDRNGKIVGRHPSAAAMRKHVSRLRRAEREAAKAA